MEWGLFDKKFCDVCGEKIGLLGNRKLEDGDLFSTDYPWFCDGAITKDGKLLMLLTDKRADCSAMELIAYTLGGF